MDEGSGDDFGDPDGFDELDEFDVLYDLETLAVLDTWDDGSHPAEQPSRLSAWSRRTALGAVLTGAALGLQEVLDPVDQRPIVIEVDDSGQPEHLPIQLFLDPDSPAGSLCVVHRDALPRPQV